MIVFASLGVSPSIQSHIINYLPMLINQTVAAFVIMCECISNNMLEIINYLIYLF